MISVVHAIYKTKERDFGKLKHKISFWRNYWRRL